MQDLDTDDGEGRQLSLNFLDQPLVPASKLSGARSLTDTVGVEAIRALEQEARESVAAVRNKAVVASRDLSILEAAAEETNNVEATETEEAAAETHLIAE